jgi:hypothetical protein
MSIKVQSFGLFVFQNAKRLSALRVPVASSRQIFETREVRFRGCKYSAFAPLGDWLAVCDGTPAVVGLQLTAFVQREIFRSSLLNAENVSNVDNDLQILLAWRDTVRTQGWPLSTVFSLRAAPDQFLLYIPEFYVEQQDIPVSEDFPGDSFESSSS